MIAFLYALICIFLLIFAAIWIRLSSGLRPLSSRRFEYAEMYPLDARSLVFSKAGTRRLRFLYLLQLLVWFSSCLIILTLGILVRKYPIMVASVVGLILSVADATKTACLLRQLKWKSQSEGNPE
jgi:hypothetical protein